METYFWVIVLRLGEIMLASALTIVIGCFVAGVMRRLIGRQEIAAFFAGNSWGSVFKAWLAGMLLPVCSLGTLPIMREMKRAGVASGTVLAFGLTAPLFNPISLLYGLTLASPWVVIVFSLCSLLIVSITGVFFNRILSDDTTPPDTERPIPPGIKRILSVVESTTRELTGPSLRFIVMGMVGAMILSLILPNGSLQSSVEPNQLFAPFVMLGVSIPMFLSPVAAMVQVAGMFEHGNSVGAAFTLLIVGAGINVGTIAWIWQSYGVRRGLNFLLALLGVVMVLAYAVDRPLYPTGVQAVGHTHAFDQFCFPVPSESELTGATVLFQLRGIAEELHVVFGLGLLVICLGVGLILTRMDRQGSLQKWFERESNQQWRVDRNLSRLTLSLASLLGLVVLSVVGCFVYYPPIPDVFAELSSVNTRLAAASISKNWQEAAHWVPAAENWTRKLTTSQFLRGETPSDYQKAKASVYLENLERLEHAIESEKSEAARKFALRCQNDLRRLKKAWMATEP